MNKIKYILISSIIIFFLNVVVHFTFDILPFKFISYFFPVNESIFQHLKMMFTSFILFYLILAFLKGKLGYQNICSALLISSLTSIISFLMIYLPLTLIFKENLIVTFILLFLAIMLGEYVGSFILLKKDYKSLNYISLFIILLILILNAALTYNPLSNFLFYDYMHHTYDIVYKN